MEDSKIVGISLLSSSIKSGYALQNLLIPNTWIDILFDFNIEFKLTGLQQYALFQSFAFICVIVDHEL